MKKVWRIRGRIYGLNVTHLKDLQENFETAYIDNIWLRVQP
jgi:hypothetical protein